MQFDNTEMPSRKEEKALEKISPFEIKNRLIYMAKADAKKSSQTLLNAGRGNPNWIATTPREAFFLLGKFAMEECRRVYDNPVGIAGIPEIEGIADRFRTFLNDNFDQAGADLLSHTFEYLVSERGADPDELAHEWAEGILGDQYPVPDRIMKYTEVIVRDYLALTMGNNAQPAGNYDLFATEGSTAGMCYVFDSLQENCLLRAGDGIALMTPIFTPY
ncbi:MAG: aspartate 4-decarboxylase, partial [Muribaculaceae bacterium]|nr:aspartate 4-decarboxylase [Muribaculaceae bacterium]